MGHVSAPPRLPRAVPAAKITVTVLNGTEQVGLAHHVAAKLRGEGFTRAAALDGSPAGANQTTLVEYSPGDRAQAQRIAKAMSVSQVKALEGRVAPLGAGAAVVVVIEAPTQSRLRASRPASDIPGRSASRASRVSPT